MLRNLLIMAGGGLLAFHLKEALKGPRHGISSVELQDIDERIDEYRKKTGDYTSKLIEAYQKMRVLEYREHHNDYTSSDDVIWHDRLRYR